MYHSISRVMISAGWSTASATCIMSKAQVNFFPSLHSTF
jgi:hypothetical protein